MFLTKRSLSRRTLLRGLGAAVALPLLDSMSPAAAREGAIPKRLGIVFVPLGERPGYWTPAQTGAMIWAIDMVDCISPMVIPWRCRPTVCVIRLVRLGRRTELPNVIIVMATSIHGM